jgi:hypothetical protein
VVALSGELHNKSMNQLKRAMRLLNDDWRVEARFTGYARRSTHYNGQRDQVA